MEKPALGSVNAVVYKVKKGKDEEFARLLALHWPTLDKLGLVKADAAKIWRGTNIRSDTGGTVWIEMFAWKDEKAPEIAHHTPEVMKVWEPMGPLLEGMDILYVDPAKL